MYVLKRDVCVTSEKDVRGEDVWGEVFLGRLVFGAKWGRYHTRQENIAPCCISKWKDIYVCIIDQRQIRYRNGKISKEESEDRVSAGGSPKWSCAHGIKVDRNMYYVRSTYFYCLKFLCS